MFSIEGIVLLTLSLLEQVRRQSNYVLIVDLVDLPTNQ